MLKLVSLYRVVSEDGEATFKVKRFEGVEVAVGDSRKLFVFFKESGVWRQVEVVINDDYFVSPSLAVSYWRARLSSRLDEYRAMVATLERKAAQEVQPCDEDEVTS